MIADKAFELVREGHRTETWKLAPFVDIALTRIFEEMKEMYEENKVGVDRIIAGEPGGGEIIATLAMKHAFLERTKRCLLVFLNDRVERLKKIRWDAGSIIAPEVRKNLSDDEVKWFNKYNKNLTKYMRSIGESGGLDLTQDTRPPKEAYIEVRCLQDYGEFELEDQDSVILQKDSTHLLPSATCQHLVKQGVLKPVNS